LYAIVTPLFRSVFDWENGVFLIRGEDQENIELTGGCHRFSALFLRRRVHHGFFGKPLISIVLCMAIVVGMSVMGRGAEATTFYVTKKSDLMPATQKSAQVSEITAGRQVYLFGGSDMVSTNTNAITPVPQLRKRAKYPVNA
jgi:hypothetical protein